MKMNAMMVAALVACASAGADVAYVGSFDLSGATCGCGKRLQVDKSVDGNPLTVGGKTYAKGFGTHPESAILFRANGKVTAFGMPGNYNGTGINRSGPLKICGSVTLGGNGVFDAHLKVFFPGNKNAVQYAKA